MRGLIGGLVAIVFVVSLPSAEAVEKTLLRETAGGFLYRMTPDGGRPQDALLLAELSGSEATIGDQHGQLLADEIAAVISARYYCAEIQAVLPWMQTAFQKMPKKFRREIRAMRNALAGRGYDFPVELVALHATQPLIGGNFAWFVCPWEEPTKPTGSFSYAVWGEYVGGGGTISAHSPDWGRVPTWRKGQEKKSLADNRVVYSVRPKHGNRFVYMGVPGVIGMPGFNETGLAIAGTAGQQGVTVMTAMPGNGVPIPDGFLTPFLVTRQVLQFFSASDPRLFDRIEVEVLAQKPLYGFIAHVTIPGRSVVWEPGGETSPDYPRNSRREAGAWDSGDITPIDYRGDFLLLPDAVLRLSALPFLATTDFSDSNGEPYFGRAWVNNSEVRWQRMQLGRAFALPGDPGRGTRFANWFAKLGTAAVVEPHMVISEKGNQGGPHIVSVRPDKTGGYWILADGSDHGSWVREGDSSFRAFKADGIQACAGPLYDFGNGVTGWCPLGDNDIEFVAWTHQYPAGALERLDGTNLCVDPDAKPLAQPGPPLFGGPHSRTHFLLRELGAPQGTLTVEEFFKTFQRAYLNVGTQDEPFGVFVFSPETGMALFAASRYEGERYIGGLDSDQRPIALDRFQLFGR